MIPCFCPATDNITASPVDASRDSRPAPTILQLATRADSARLVSHMADMAIRSRLRQLPRTLSQLGGSVSSASGPPGPARLDPASPWRAAGDPGRLCAVAPSAPVGCDRSRRHTRRPAFCRTARPSLCLGHSGAQTVGPVQAWPRAFARGPALKLYHRPVAMLEEARRQAARTLVPGFRRKP